MNKSLKEWLQSIFGHNERTTINHRVLTKPQLLQINATVITGLLILMTLQSFSAPIYEKLSYDFLSRFSNILIDIEKNQKMLDQMCDFSQNGFKGKQAKFDETCTEISFHLNELQNEKNAVLHFYKPLKLVDEGGSIGPSLALTFFTNIISNIVIILMITPFAFSSFYELTRKKRWDDDEFASYAAIKSTAFGFGIIIIGLLFLYFIALNVNSFTSNLE